MDTTPHSHRVDFRDTGSYFFVNYGDQNETRAKPIRFWWDSEEAYNKRCVRRARMHIKRMIRKHDRATRAAEFSVVDLPDLRADQWGSEQL